MTTDLGRIRMFGGQSTIIITRAGYDICGENMQLSSILHVFRSYPPTYQYPPARVIPFLSRRRHFQILYTYLFWLPA